MEGHHPGVQAAPGQEDGCRPLIWPSDHLPEVVLAALLERCDIAATPPCKRLAKEYLGSLQVTNEAVHVRDSPWVIRAQQACCGCPYSHDVVVDGRQYPGVAGVCYQASRACSSRECRRHLVCHTSQDLKSVVCTCMRVECGVLEWNESVAMAM